MGPCQGASTAVECGAMVSTSSEPNKKTPFLSQYLEIKGRYADTLLFFRMGDFYELFFEDAVVAAKALEITLTARNKNEAEPIPMCGVPHHSAAGYINKLVALGHRVALCEQLEDPAKTKGIVKRDVVQVITPGTQFDPMALESKTANETHSAQVGPRGQGVAFATIDYTTGAFSFGFFDTIEAWVNYLRVRPIVEILLPEDDGSEALVTALDNDHGVQHTLHRVSAHWYDDRYACERLYEQFQTKNLGAIHHRLTSMAESRQCAGVLIKYFQTTQVRMIDGINVVPLVQRLSYHNEEPVMDLDPSTIIALDLLPKRMANMADRSQVERRDSLFHVLDHTATAMGGRRLKQWLCRPSTDLSIIGDRLDHVSLFLDDLSLRRATRDALSSVYDLERLMVRVTLGRVTPKELQHLALSLDRIFTLCQTATDAGHGGLFQRLFHLLSQELVSLAQSTVEQLVDEPPYVLKDGGLFKKGISSLLDEYITLSEDGSQWLAEYEARERSTTGIASLKVRFNKVFGYYIEITKANLDAVPPHYVRKQTTANGERYITEELKAFEDKVLNAESRRVQLENKMFQELRARWSLQRHRVGQVAQVVSEMDVLASFAEVSAERQYVRPELLEESGIDVLAGRHPLVELKGGFVANDVALGVTASGFAPVFALITGPNMGGKSTIMRQTALICLMAQMGCYVPADRARLGLVDRIFTRIGASDNIAEGQSTFMVEMSEMSTILKNASSKSLVLLDEIGRGTSTYDGLSLAWALCEEIISRVGCLTLFATHYHELTALADHFTQVANWNVGVEVSDESHDVRFLYRLHPGAATRSYGIAVARLAGLPPRVLDRAQQILSRLEQSKQAAKQDGSTKKPKQALESAPQLGLF